MRNFSVVIKPSRLHILNKCWTYFTRKHLVIFYLDKCNNDCRELDD